MKKYLSLFMVLMIFTANVYAFSHLSFVSFKNGGKFIQGEDVQTNTVERVVKPFSMNKYETTYGIWYEVRKQAEKIGYYFANPGQGGSAGRRGAVPNESNIYQPVTMINWYDAIIWCNALSELKGRTPCYSYNGKVLRDSSDTAACDLAVCDWACNGFRLPSEAEWEYASRISKNGTMHGDMASGQSSYDDEQIYLYSWIEGNSGVTRIVGTAGVPFDSNVIAEPATGNANFAGLFDMTGNVLEFCWDWFGEYKEDELYGPELAEQRISRGGSCSEYTMFLYTADRYSYDPNEAYNYFGFRIAYSE